MPLFERNWFEEIGLKNWFEEIGVQKPAARPCVIDRLG